MATQQTNERTKLDKKLGELYAIEHTLYDSENGLNLKHGDIIQTECVNWIKRMGSCISELRGLPPKRKVDEVIIVTGCVEDGGLTLGERADLSSQDPKSRLKPGQDPGDEVGDEDEDEEEEPTPRGRKFQRRGAGAGA